MTADAASVSERQSCSPSKRTAWNKGRNVGERYAFSLPETQKILAHLQCAGELHDACVFTVGIDSMLRGSDLLSLKVSDVVSSDGRIQWRQKKTGQNVFPVLTTTTQDAVKKWVWASGKNPDDFLFTRNKRTDGPPLCTGHFRALIKEWTAAIGLPNERYSSHSLRRTKPSYLYHYGLADIATISILLGHADTAVTLRYLGIRKEEAHAAALAGDIFTGDVNAEPLAHPLLRELLGEQFLERMANEIASRVYRKSPDLFDDRGGFSRK